MIRYLLSLLLLATPAVAQQVEDCDWRASAGVIAEPWENNSRSFANGDVRLALLDAGEPAIGGYYILVLSPPRGELGDRQCRIVSYKSYGFGRVTFKDLTADYDPAQGLRFRLPVRVVDEPTGAMLDRTLTFTLNQSSGEIGPALSP
ncbi:hypothetical protein GCM10011360_34070 [Primorskyibacter flagellatus]|uniref:Uncharacterized protein n=1 Tax=Primorskyibacter flagellatus TaxID=1387277 RepID=A0A917EHF0_9RHOB|nr:hypothetical protein [Primorskyibacter flagellatus]GGE44011.1 hypothetical protein GCM10011360_34070 [Primorskyibacter flagellatus]